MLEPVDVLAVMAHPDDAELLVGGTLVKCSDRGQRAAVLDLTRGEAGSAGSPELRAREADAAAAVMGLVARKNVGLPDSNLFNTLAARQAVVAALRELRPRVVLTHWTAGRHPDHRVAAELVRDACFLSGLRNFDAPGAPHRPRSVAYATAFREDAPAPSFVIDITNQIDRKIEALACYGSQFSNKTQAGEVYPGGDRDLLDQIRAHAAHAGSRIRAAYGEPFVTAETLELDTPAGLTVSSF
jgi:bacillithiol biosynthesis deacetylase BshB1